MFQWYRKFCCWIGWHSHSFFRKNNGFENVHKSPDDPNQFLNFAQCRWCHYEGQIDSQGNLF